jgi:hypothetical protein
VHRLAADAAGASAASVELRRATVTYPCLLSSRQTSTKEMVLIAVCVLREYLPRIHR